MTHAGDDLQVIVLGVDSPIGLTLIRELAAHGVRVHGLAWSPAGIGLHSRDLDRGRIRERDETALVAQLNALAAETGAHWLLTVAESDIDLLHRRHAELVGLTPLIPPAAAFARVLDKAETYRIATGVGIRTPRTWEITSSAGLDALAVELPFPLVLKWANPAEVRTPLATAGIALDKYRYVHDLDELRAYCAPLDAVGAYPLIQEHCPGHGLGQMLLMHRGEPVLRFQHRRLAEFPPEGGVSAVCESVAIDEPLMARSVALLRALAWEGPAMVEYRHAPGGSEPCLMEINGRFWGSQPLAWHAGAHFAWGLLALAARGAIPPAPPPRIGLRARFFIPELRRLQRIVLHPERIQDRRLRFAPGRELLGFLLAYLDPRSRYYVFSLRDPMPFLADLWHTFKGLLAR